MFVVSPLLALMQDQVGKFQQRSMKCTFLGKSSQEKVSVIAGNYQLVYLTPERLLQDLELRDVFRSP